MKIKLPLVLIIFVSVTSVQAQELLAGWDFSQQDANRDRPSVAATGVHVFQSSLSNFTFNGNKYSSNGLWGTAALNPQSSKTTTVSTSLKQGVTAIQDLTLILDAGSPDYLLSSLNFQFLIPFNNSARDLKVSYLSGLDGATNAVTLFSLSNSVIVDDWAGQDIDLTNFFSESQLTISAGDSIVFRFDFTDLDKSGSSFLDNIAIVGSVVPEAHSYSLICACIGLITVMVRRAKLFL